MNRERIPFATSSGSLFKLTKPTPLSLSQGPSLFDALRQPHEKPPNSGSQIVRGITSDLLTVFAKCNPRFTYDPINNPKRCLTIPSEGTLNGGFDNVNNEYILFVNDIIRSPENEEYIIMELLGKGTFGQVIRCVRKPNNEIFAIKVIKNKPAYTNQALMEVKIYKKLKEDSIASEANEDHVVRLYDYFVFRNHICLVMELLHVSLYDLLRLSNFSGFSLKFIGRLTEQILESMICLERNKIIHCDMKPENVLFADEESDAIKVIDLGSSCFLHNTLYTYIQSRFYRAPEVILGMKYTHKIDSWSVGCMVAEFYLGLPIFPGSSEYDQMRRIVDVVGLPDDEFIEASRFKNKFFKKENEVYAFKTVEEYEQEQNTKIPPHKKYFILKKLEDLEMYYNKSKQREKQPQEKQRFEVFLHFLKGLLQFNPARRWTASQARMHPFLTGQPFDANWEPLSHPEALAAHDKDLVKKEDDSSGKHSSSGFKNAATQEFNAESYRPFIPVDNADKKKEVISQSQNVYLLNSQTSSNKPKSKLNLNAATFKANTFQVPNINIDTQNKGEKQGSRSEPNSARSYRKNEKGPGQVEYTHQEVNEEENYEGQQQQQPQTQPAMQGMQPVMQGMQPAMQGMQPAMQGMQPAMQGMQPAMQGMQGGYNPQANMYYNNNYQYNQYNNQYNQYNQGQGQGQGGGYKQTNNAPQNQQFYPPPGQYGYGYVQQQQDYGYRQRSNSDHGASDNISFQKNKGKHYQHGKNKNFQYTNDQTQQMGGQQPEYTATQQQQQQYGQPKQGNKWSENPNKGSGYKNKNGNKNYYPTQSNKEELKEK